MPKLLFLKSLTLQQSSHIQAPSSWRGQQAQWSLRVSHTWQGISWPDILEPPHSTQHSEASRTKGNTWMKVQNKRLAKSNKYECIKQGVYVLAGLQEIKERFIYYFTPVLNQTDGLNHCSSIVFVAFELLYEKVCLQVWSCEWRNGAF